MERDAAVQTLVDENAVRAVTARYARAVDRLDWQLLRSCYHPDAVDVHGGVAYTLDGLVEYLRERLPRSAATVHFIGNQLIEIDGDTAWAETYCLARHRDVAGGAATDFTQLVRYCDRLERREGEWRFAERVVVYEPGRVDALDADSPFAALAAERGVAAARDRDDLSYRRSVPLWQGRRP